MTSCEKVTAAAIGFAERFDPYELADLGWTFEELADETARLLETEPMVVLEYFKEERCW